MTKVNLVFITTCFLLLFCGKLVWAESGYVDVHVHLDPTGLTQKGHRSTKRPRGPRQSARGGDIDYKDMAKNIISSMDRMGVEKAVLLPPPQIPSQQRAKSTYETYYGAVKYYPKRLCIGAGGGTLNPMIYQYDKDEISPEIRQEFREKAEKLAASGIAVFGEMTALHLSMNEHHIFAQVDPDHPLFLLLADIAAKNNIPIDLHMEAVPEDMPTPKSLLTISHNNPKTLKANISGLERLLEHNPKAKIVWQHIGWDNIGYMTIELLTNLLKKHPNLYLALRVENRRMKIDNSAPMPNRIVDEDWNVYPKWAKFISDFSDRIVIGSDDFMGIQRRGSRHKDSFKETWHILEQFPEEIARKIGHDNAVRIYNIAL